MESEQNGQKVYPLKSKLSWASGTLLSIGGIDILAHLGPTGLVIGGIAAYAAWEFGPEMFGGIRRELAAFAPTQPAPPTALRKFPKSGKRSIPDRLLGRYPVEEDSPEERDGDGVLVISDDVYYEDEEEMPPLPQPQAPVRPSSGDYIPKNCIDLAADVRIPLSDLAGKAIFVCGIRRHGKTTLGARLAEQLGKHYIPLFVPCLEGDYLSLADVLPRAIVAGHSGATASYQAYSFVQLDEQKTAYRLGYDILEMGYQVILDMASYTQLDVAVAMQINIIKGMFHWANTHPDKRVPAHVFLDEAQRYLPQTLNDSVILDKTLLAELLRVYMDIIAIGGKRGIAPVILTQRFAQVNKKIMAQSEVFFLMRQTNDGDLDRCMEYVNSDIATKEQISRFQPGQGVYIASDGTQLVTRFKQRDSSGKRSSTPQAEGAYRYANMPMRKQEHAAAPAPQGARQSWDENTPEGEAVDAQPESNANALFLTPQILQALKLWAKGVKGPRALEREMQITYHQAGKICKQLQEMGLIDESESD